MNRTLFASIGIALAFAASPALAQSAQGDSKVDNGTDPTRVTRKAEVTWEHLDLVGGFNSDQFKLNLTLPMGAKSDYSLKFKVPVSSVDVFGNDDYDVGDASVTVGHVFGLNKEGGWVVQGELVFDTAARPELGTGQNVLKATVIRARFLEGGAIFAPALVHSESLWGQDDRADVRSTTLDLYYVPKLSDPRNLITYDPSINVDWENDKEFLGLAVTFGRVIGPMFGGNGIVTVKPSVFAGDERPSSWGVEVGFKVIGF